MEVPLCQILELVCMISLMSLYYMHDEIDQVLGEKLINVFMCATHNKQNEDQSIHYKHKMT